VVHALGAQLTNAVTPLGRSLNHSNRVAPWSDSSAVQEILPGLFQYFRFQVIESTNFCATAKSPKSTAKARDVERIRAIR
jgi:hypothetical protein